MLLLAGIVAVGLFGVSRGGTALTWYEAEDSGDFAVGNSIEVHELRNPSSLRSPSVSEKPV